MSEGIQGVQINEALECYIIKAIEDYRTEKAEVEKRKN